MAAYTLDLADLLLWTRRVGGDPRRLRSETLEADGGTLLQLSAEGLVQVRAVRLDGTPSPFGDWTSSDAFLTLPANTPAGTEVYVQYENARFTDAQILGFLVDGASRVAGDLRGVSWSPDPDAFRVTDDHGELDPAHRESNTLRSLIVFAASANLYGDVANAAANDAIKIRDGDTSIDTAATATAAGRNVERLQVMYHQALRAAQNQRFTGVSGATAFAV